MYCDIDDVKARYSEDYLLSLAIEEGEIDETVFEQAISDAGGELLPYLAWYELEAPYPDLIIKLCVEMTINSLLRRIEQTAGDSEFRSRQDWIDKTLKDLLNKKLQFGLTEEEEYDRARFGYDDSREW